MADSNGDLSYFTTKTPISVGRCCFFFFNMAKKPRFQWGDVVFFLFNAAKKTRLQWGDVFFFL